MTDFVVYGTPLSPFVRKVEVVLRQAGAAYDFENINIMDMPDWFVEMSPAKRIPVLRDKTIGTEGTDGTIPDSSAICLFLEKRLETGLYGTNAFEAGRIAWFEEYGDAVLAPTIGLGLFRPLIFPLFAGKPQDIKTAKQTLHEKLPAFFDYLETALDGKTYFVGDRYSLADIAIGTQLVQIDLVADFFDSARWPALFNHLDTMKTKPGFAENLGTCAAMLKSFMPSKADLRS